MVCSLKYTFCFALFLFFKKIPIFNSVRRRIAAKKRKLKATGKSKSTDTEDESTYDYCEDDGNTFDSNNILQQFLSSFQ